MHLYTKNKNTYLRMGTSMEELNVLSGADPFDVYKNTALVASKAAYRLQNSPNCFQGFEWSSSKLHFRITYS